MQLLNVSNRFFSFSHAPSEMACLQLVHSLWQPLLSYIMSLPEFSKPVQFLANREVQGCITALMLMFIGPVARYWACILHTRV